MDAFIGVFIAALSVILSGWMLKVERKRDAVAKEESITARAAGLNAWTAVVEAPPAPPENAEGAPAPKAKYGVQVQNSTQVPVYDMVILATTAKGTIFPLDLKLDTVPPGDYFFQSSFGGGRASWDFGNPSAGIHGLHPVMRKPEWRVVCMSFRDAYGQWWVRTPDGLMRQESRPAAEQVTATIRQGVQARTLPRSVENASSASPRAATKVR